MIKDILVFLAKLTGFSLLLFVLHYYILYQFFNGTLYFPLWSIYCFNALMVFTVFLTVRYYSQKKLQNIFKVFLILTVSKMILSIIFLLPLFLKKSGHTQMEIFNFFIPYFLYLIFEIVGLNKFLQKT